VGFHLQPDRREKVFQSERVQQFLPELGWGGMDEILRDAMRLAQPVPDAK
jgi:hypothetical protein